MNKYDMGSLTGLVRNSYDKINSSYDKKQERYFHLLTVKDVNMYKPLLFVLFWTHPNDPWNKKYYQYHAKNTQYYPVSSFSILGGPIYEKIYGKIHMQCKKPVIRNCIIFTSAMSLNKINDSEITITGHNVKQQRERTITLSSVTEGDNVTVDKLTEAVPSLEDNPNIDKVISLFNFIKTYRDPNEEHIKKLELNSDILDMRNKSGDTPLMVAALHKNLKVMKFLVENGAEVNTVNENSGDTALMLAVSEGYKDIVKFLIEKGANVNAVSFERNESVYEVAQYAKNVKKRPAAMNILFPHDPERQPSGGLTVENGAGVNLQRSESMQDDAQKTGIPYYGTTSLL
jgi:hypothetical protein